MLSVCYHHFGHKSKTHTSYYKASSHFFPVLLCRSSTGCTPFREVRALGWAHPQVSVLLGMYLCQKLGLWGQVWPIVELSGGSCVLRRAAPDLLPQRPILKLLLTPQTLQLTPNTVMYHYAMWFVHSCLIVSLSPNGNGQDKSSSRLLTFIRN